MTTVSDYDTRRVSDADAARDRSALRELAPLPESSTSIVDDDLNDATFFELPGADLSGEELSVTVIPQQDDEFTCSSCFLVQHRSRLRSPSSEQPICADCA
jgi:Domain of unknown function (DUF4193)